MCNPVYEHKYKVFLVLGTKINQTTFQKIPEIMIAFDLTTFRYQTCFTDKKSGCIYGFTLT